METTRFDVSASDPDLDALTLSADLPMGCNLFITGSTPGSVFGFIQCDPDIQAGMYTATVTVTDAKGAMDSETFSLTVLPFLDTGGGQTVVQGEQVQLNPSSSTGAVVELDLDNDGVYESPAPATFDATGLAPGDYLVGVRATRNGVSNTGSIIVTVVSSPEEQILALEPDDLELNADTDEDFRAFIGPKNADGNADGNPDVGDDGVPGTADDDFQPASVIWEVIPSTLGTLDILNGTSTTFTATQPGSGQVRATDADGRTASADVTVRSAWTYDDLRRLTSEYVDNPFVARGLALLVDLAAAVDSRGFDRVADGILDAYIRSIRAITPRLLTPEERDELVNGAQALQQQ